MGSINIKNLEKFYGKEKVVKNINLDIKDKEFVVLIGPSGSGKSTTLRMLAGLEDITKGEVFFDETLVNDLPPRLRNIAMVFQSYALYPHLSIRDNLGFGLKIAKFSKTAINERVLKVSKMLELDEHLGKKPSQCSGGQRQRVAMGRAIVREPNIFLFDEPLSNLDAKLRAKMRLEIKLLHQKLQKTIVYVTHDQVEAMTLASKVVVMKDGQIEQVGTPIEVFSNPRNIFVATFLGSPAMNLTPAVCKDSKFVLKDGHTLPIPKRYAKHVKPNQEVIIGVRSESLTPNLHKNVISYYSFDTKILAVEPLGATSNLFIDFGKEQFISRMNHPKEIQIGEEMKFYLNLDKLYCFDAKTKIALDAKE